MILMPYWALFVIYMYVEAFDLILLNVYDHFSVRCMQRQVQGLQETI